MDATRARRTKDQVRQWWYAAQRQRRFARHLGFPLTPEPCREGLREVVLAASASSLSITTVRVA
jgi:hypothetical protein